MINKIKKMNRAPKAFAGLARRHNEIARALTPLLNLSGGTGIIVTKADGNVVVSIRDR